jgi:peptide/nickel transport system substrate-binding protein
MPGGGISRLYALLAAAVFSAWVGLAHAGSTVRAVMHSDLKILDPIWTPATITRLHGYMVYDTLFAMDEDGQIKPQMVQNFDVSADKLTYTFTLRDGLLWHDGQPVTSEDCVASLRRWSARDVTVFTDFVDGFSVIDAKTFALRLKQPTGLVLSALGKSAGIVPFMMPRRVAETDPGKQISDNTGSGPFVFKRDEWRPGDSAVYSKFDKYQPRPEPASGFAGGKVVNIDRVEWRAVSDHLQAINALLAGEIDIMEQPPHDLYPLLKAHPDIQLVKLNVLGQQYLFRPNWLAKPFDNPGVRQALWYAFNQGDFLKAVIGDPDFYRTCKSYFICDTTFASERGTDQLLSSDFGRSRQLLRDAGYDGTPIVLLHSTDLNVLTNLAPVAKQLMEKGGFVVDMQSMDWQTLVARRAKKDSPLAGGWNAFLTATFGAELLDPAIANWLAANCDKALPGWPCDAKLEQLRNEFARQIDPAEQVAVAHAVQQRALEVTPYVPLGQWYALTATRKSISSLLKTPTIVFWNLRKSET